ncbi:MAG TPA: flagellar biosynthesis protein FliQ [Burkholderiales bacterium]|nr:flagellar biosynthesis protein FliQ [Pseudomonadota bacterium]HVC49369.1 flagellar biosynthesis protein FliQ [Burkholderiales bacterium]
MTPDTVIHLAQQTVYLMLLLSAPMLLGALAVGLIVSIFQAATQINESTLSFIPKLAALFIIVVVFGPWMLGQLMDFTRNLFMSIPSLIG